jgi:hypothetical protein
MNARCDVLDAKDGAPTVLYGTGKGGSVGHPGVGLHLNMVERLVVNEPMDFVLLGEAFNRIHLVLRDAAVNIAGDADIKRADTVGQDIDLRTAERVSQRYR